MSTVSYSKLWLLKVVSLEADSIYVQVRPLSDKSYRGLLKRWRDITEKETITDIQVLARDIEIIERADARNRFGSFEHGVKVSQKIRTETLFVFFVNNAPSTVAGNKGPEERGGGEFSRN